MAQHDLKQYLQRALADARPGALAVAFSGGMDSSALLHALAQLPAARARDLRAMHIDHGLHADSAAWSEHCRAVAAELDVALDVVRVEVERNRGTGLEDSARVARRAAFARLLLPGAILALAHHRNDQAETVLLKLLRGAGPEGLGGMRDLRDFGAGYLWRPLLAESRSTLLAYAHEYELHWLDDPSNSDMTLRRNFLRGDILPRLRTAAAQAPAGTQEMVPEVARRL